jgi:methylase of polypeptide subunit release factors
MALGRVRLMLWVMGLSSGRARWVRACGLQLYVAPGVCNPSPIPFASFGVLFVRGVSGLQGKRVLDMGTGSGIWALLAIRGGANVTASDLEGTDLSAIARSAERNGLGLPELCVGDLFASLSGRVFDCVLFNPPFHVGTPKTQRERAYLGGEDGELVLRFLADVPAVLAPQGVVRMILPRLDRSAYESALRGFDVRTIETVFRPILGTTDLLEITPKEA